MRFNDITNAGSSADKDVAESKSRVIELQASLQVRNVTIGNLLPLF
jgi:hypothetical protein